jgi:hypothetical protein
MRTLIALLPFVTILLALAPGSDAIGSNSDATSLIPDEPSTVVVKINPAIRNMVELQVASLSARVVLDESDAVPGTTATISGAVGGSSGTSSSVIETLTLTFDRDVDFYAYPSFVLGTPQGSKSSDASYNLEFYDGVATVPLRQINPAPPQALSYSGKLTFFGGFFTPFHATAGRAYVARLTSAASGSPVRVATLAVARTVVLPPTNSVSGIVHSNIESGFGRPGTDAMTATTGTTTAFDFPPSASGGVSVSLRASSEKPGGIEPFSGEGVTPMPYYVDASLDKGASFKSAVTMTLVLPLTRTFFPKQYRLALFAVTRGLWTPSIANPARRQGDILRFIIPAKQLTMLRHPGRYVFSLYTVDASNDSTSSGPVVAVIGDSINVLTILPQSTVYPAPTASPDGTCTTGWTNGCEYTVDATLSWPGVVAQLIGARVYNLARYDNAETIIGTPSMLQNQVPYIPEDADFVVFEGGRGDFIADVPDDPSPHLGIIIQAIAARATHAKIILMSPFCYVGNKGVEWSAAEKVLTRAHGAFIDAQSFPDCGEIIAHPDRLHESPQGNRSFGMIIAGVISSMMQNHPSAGL